MPPKIKMLLKIMFLEGGGMKKQAKIIYTYFWRLFLAAKNKDFPGSL
jgi:hypothetical protein